jgi:transcriptional regulator with GAF, ATPase, and Fis domain
VSVLSRVFWVPSMPVSSRRGGKSGTVPLAVPQTVKVPRIAVRVEREAGAAVSRDAMVDGDRCRIGSHPSNDVVLADPLVSRFHCSLVRGSSGWAVLDSDSLNGTRLDGVRVRDADLPHSEAVIEVGGSLLRVGEASSVAEQEVPALPAFGDLVGASVAMRRLFGLLARVAESESNVLIQGESGTGKEAIALEVVRRSARAKKPLLIVDCGAIAPSVIESELFGHARGAFTGADRERIGAFEEADGGTIILDEIGEMPLEMQPKLLRAIEAGQVRRVGENHARTVDVRVIAATHRRLEREVNHGRFREDLFFRLSVVTVHVPPLREHIEDLPILVRLFLTALGASQRAEELFPAHVLAEMARFDWPGNVRELRNYVERAVVLDAPWQRGDGAHAHGPAPSSQSGASLGDVVGAIDLDQPFTSGKKRVVEEFERRYLAALLGWAKGNISQAARKGGMDRMYLHRLVQRHGMKRGGAIDE